MQRQLAALVTLGAWCSAVWGCAHAGGGLELSKHAAGLLYCIACIDSWQQVHLGGGRRGGGRGGGGRGDGGLGLGGGGRGLGGRGLGGGDRSCTRWTWKQECWNHLTLVHCQECDPIGQCTPVVSPPGQRWQLQLLQHAGALPALSDVRIRGAKTFRLVKSLAPALWSWTGEAAHPPRGDRELKARS